MKNVLKKTMAVAGVLTCLFVSTAFAQRVTTTPEQDKATQEAALKSNKAYDAARGYKNEAPAVLKEEAAEKKAEGIKEAAPADDSWKDAVARDKATQEAALKENREYDAARGYLNR